MGHETDRRKKPDRLDQIVESAAVLFAERGFHGVTTRQIAAAVGLNIATVHHHVGCKLDLYKLIFEHMHQEEQAMVEDFRKRVEDTIVHRPDALEGLMLEMVDELLEMMRRRPERIRLYMRRWMEPPDWLSQMQNEASLAMFGTLCGVFIRIERAGLLRPGVDVRLFLRNLDWMVYGYFISGPVERKQWRGDPQRPENLRAFRGYLHEYVRRMLGIDEVRQNARVGKIQRRKRARDANSK